MSRFTNVLFASSAMIAAFSMPALATSAFDGPYVGASLGYSWLNPDLETTIPSVGSQQVDKSYDGFTGVGFFGYGQTFDSFYVGGEAELGWSGQDQTERVGTNPYTIEGGLTYGIALRAGVLADKDTLVYGRVGWQRSELDINSQLNNVVTIGGTIPRISGTETLDGWRVGGGVERVVSDNVLARVEYSYTNYEDVTLAYSAAQARTKLKADDHALRVGVAYRF